MVDKDEGIHHKFNVERTDGSSAPGGKHENCFHWVLDTVHDPFSAPAIQGWAEAAGKEGYYTLAGELFKLLLTMPAQSLRVQQIVARVEAQTEDDPEFRRRAVLRSAVQAFGHLVHASLMAHEYGGTFTPFGFDEQAIESQLLEAVEHLSGKVMRDELLDDGVSPEVELAGTAMLLWLQRRILKGKLIE